MTNGLRRFNRHRCVGPTLVHEELDLETLDERDQPLGVAAAEQPRVVIILAPATLSVSPTASVVASLISNSTPRRVLLSA